MEKYGFNYIRTDFATIDLTPDKPEFSSAFAHNMIDADRYVDLDAIDFVLHKMPEHVTVEEIEEMKRLTNAKYDTRIV